MTPPSFFFFFFKHGSDGYFFKPSMFHIELMHHPSSLNTFFFYIYIYFIVFIEDVSCFVLSLIYFFLSSFVLKIKLFFTSIQSFC